MKNSLINQQESITNEKDLLRAKARQQHVITELGLKSISGTDLRILMNEAVRELSEVLDVEYTKVLELLPGGKRVILRAGHGWHDHIVVDQSTVDTGKNSQAGYTLYSEHPVIVKDLRTETRFNGPPLLTEHGVVSGMSCIIWGKGNKPYGILGAHSTRKHNFTDDDVTFLQAVANILAATIQSKKVEAKQQEGEHNLKQIIDGLPVAYYSCDAEGKIEIFNEPAEELWGRSPKKGKDLWCGSWRIYNPDGSPLPLDDCPMAVTLREGKPVRGQEIIVERPDGTRLNVLPYPQPIFSPSGELTGAINVLVDITPIKTAEGDLRKSEKQFRALADNIPNLCWMADASGKVYWYNSRWYEYTGTTPEEMESIGWKAFHDPKVLPEVLKEWENSLETGIPFEKVLPLKNAAGEFRPFLTRTVPVKDDHGKIIQWFGTNTDITEREELSKQKDEFMGIASHELKTPLTTIKAYAQLLESRIPKSENPKVADMLGKMNQQVTKLDDLIKELLDVTKIENGKLRFHMETFDFNTLVEDIVEEVQLVASQQIVLENMEPTTVFGDRERIGQVITNYLTNAVKYAPDSDKVVVRCEISPANGRPSPEIIFSVEDFGIGLSREDEKKVFQRFFRANSSEMNAISGIGLGLFISSEIISRHDGRVWLETEEDKGSTFYFSLPVNGQKELKRKPS